MPLYLFGEDARKFLRMQGSNLRIGDAFCVEIDECGEWYVRPVKDTIRNLSGAVASKKRKYLFSSLSLHAIKIVFYPAAPQASAIIPYLSQ